MQLQYLPLWGLSLVVSLVCGLPQGPVLASAPLTLQTSSGIVTGFVNQTRSPYVRQFLSIPYALPPIGSLRFQPPVPMLSGASIQATSLPPSCMQAYSAPQPGSAFGAGFLITGRMSEDCLYANVYTPLNAAPGSLPVVIWIYGGAFVSGGSDVPFQIPDKWVDRTKSHIVVTFNYRVNVFGYPNARAQASNPGLLDQRLVVEWVQRNIASFGGDPTRILIWGQSAGAAAVGLYGYAYYSNPIIVGAIAHSGSATMLIANDTSHTMFTSLAGQVGCGNLTAQAELACVQNVPASAVLNAMSTIPSLFVPAPDNITAFTPATAAERAATGKLARYQMIMGTTSDEGAAFGGFDPITCPVESELDVRVKYGYLTHRYYYSGNFSNITPLGPTHSADLPLVFGTIGEYGTPTQFEGTLSTVMQDLWFSFISNTAAPLCGQGQCWPLYNPSTPSMAWLGNDSKAFQLVSDKVVTASC
ncbi:alpha/beta-hydrolase [Thozetella sp. PMI_491]|nr:alpha/beta-hydrolase [Thozetella sp. PMI_491]